MTAVTFHAYLKGHWCLPTLPVFLKDERPLHLKACCADLVFAIFSKALAWRHPDMQALLGLGQDFLIRLKFELPLTAAFLFSAVLTATGKRMPQRFHNFSPLSSACL